MRKVIFYALGLLAFAVAGQAFDRSLAPSVRAPADRIYVPGDPVQPAPVVLRARHRQPHRDDFLGERFLAGRTYYDYQSNGSLGRMIALDGAGNIHLTFMDGATEDMANGVRDQKYNYFTDGWLEADGARINDGTRGGYGAIYLTNEEEQRALAFFHQTLNGNLVAMCGIDFGPGWGAFQNIALPYFGDTPGIWPQGVMSPDGIIHVIVNRRDARMIGYANGDLNEEGLPQFGDVLSPVGETHLNTFRIAQSPNSERVALTWLTSRAGIPAPEAWDGFLAYQMFNDLMLAVSDQDGNLNFNDPINVTDNIPPNPRAEGEEAYGDTLYPYSTHDVIFDSNDNLHIVFDARLLRLEPVPESAPPVEDLSVDRSYLFHWSEETNEITPVADGWWSQWVVDDNGDTITFAIPGAWKSNVCAPSLSYDEDGNLYCVYNIYPHGDYSTEHYGSGDIAVTVSADNGATWSVPTFLVETRNPGADLGESFCELYPSTWISTDGMLHISYEMDPDPGSSIQDYGGRNEVISLCDWYYQRIPLDEIERDEIWRDGPTWHAEYNVSVERPAPTLPYGFEMTGVHPNPFNNVTTISFFSGQRREVTVRALDLSGREVGQIFNGSVDSGEHQVAWNAAGLPAGVYLIALTDGAHTSFMKAALVK